MNIPEGWKLVPVEPTGEMMSAAWDHAPADMADMDDGYFGKAYQDMLAVAPMPPAQEDEPVAWISPEALEYGTRPSADGTLVRMYVGGTLKRGIPLYTRPDSGLRKAAEEAIDAIRALEGTEIPYPIAMKLSAAVKNLRAELNKGEA